MRHSKHSLHFAATGVLLAATMARAQTVPVAVIQSPVPVDVNRVAFSHDGKWVATIDQFGRDPTLWDAKTGAKALAFSHANAVIEAPNKSAPNESMVMYSFHPKGEYPLVFSPDDRYVAAFDARNANSNAPVVWDRETGEVIRPWKLDATNQLRLSDTNLTLTEVRTWRNGDRGTLPGSLATPQYFEPQISKIALSADGEKLAVARGYLGLVNTNDLIEVWSLRGSKSPYTFAKDLLPVKSLAFSHDSQWVASASQTSGIASRYTAVLIGEVHLWHVVGGAEIRLIPKDADAIDGYWSATNVAFSVDDKQLVADVFTTGDSISRDEEGGEPESLSFYVRATFFDVATGHAMNSTPLGDEFSAFSLSSDGRRALVWRERFTEVNTLTGHRLNTFQTPQLTVDPSSFEQCEPGVHSSGFAAFSADIKRVVISSGKQVQILDTKMGTSTAGNAQIVADEPNETWGTLSGAFSPSGATLALAVCGSRLHTGELRFYSVSKLEQFAVSRPDSVVTSIAFTPDGTLLFAGGYDGALRVFETQHCSQVATLFRSIGGEWIVFTPDGLYDASANGTSLLAWRLKGEIVSASDLPGMRLPGLLSKLVSGEHPKPTRPLTSAIANALPHSDR